LNSFIEPLNFQKKAKLIRPAGKLAHTLMACSAKC